MSAPLRSSVLIRHVGRPKDRASPSVLRNTRKRAAVIKRLKGKIVSLNDHPRDSLGVRPLPEGHGAYQLQVGGGKGVERAQLIIYSWDETVTSRGARLTMGHGLYSNPGYRVITAEPVSDCQT